MTANKNEAVKSEAQPLSFNVNLKTSNDYWKVKAFPQGPRQSASLPIALLPVAPAPIQPSSRQTSLTDGWANLSQTRIQTIR